MAVETLLYTYTSKVEVEKRCSAQGVALRVDDLVAQGGTVEADFWVELIAEATDYINQYCNSYDPASMADNRWVRSRATWVACYKLSERRGNQGQFNAEFLRITDELEKVQTEQLVIPRLPRRHKGAPSLSNIIVDDRSTQPLRVEFSTSVGQPSGETANDYETIDGFDVGP